MQTDDCPACGGVELAAAHFTQRGRSPKTPTRAASTASEAAEACCGVMLPSTLGRGPRIDEQLTELESIMPSTVVLGARSARSESESPTTPPCQFWAHATSSLLQAISSGRVQGVQTQASDFTTMIDSTAPGRRYDEPDLGLANLRLTRQCLRGSHLSSTRAATCEPMQDATSSISRAARCGSGFDLMEDMTGENEHAESSPTSRYCSPTDLRLSPASRAIERMRRRTRPFPRNSSSRRASEYKRSRLSSGVRLAEPDRRLLPTLQS